MEDYPVSVDQALKSPDLDQSLITVVSHLLQEDDGEYYLVDKVFSIERHLGSRKTLWGNDQKTLKVAGNEQLVKSMEDAIAYTRDKNSYDPHYNAASVVAIGKLNLENRTFEAMSIHLSSCSDRMRV